MLDDDPKPNSSRHRELEGRPFVFPDPVDDLRRSIEQGEDHIVATGRQARELCAQLAELRRLRHKAFGGSIFKRARSPYWQIRYSVDGKWRDESTITKDRREAQRE